MISHSIPSRLTGRPRKGFTLIEAMTVVTMMAIISAMAVPSFRLAMEESKADIAQANLRAIWAAERFYWMSNRQYTEDINTLVSLGLLDGSLTTTAINYSYAISTDAENATFTATATRAGSSVWVGSYSINELGVFSGTVTSGTDRDITLSPQ